MQIGAWAYKADKTTLCYTQNAQRVVPTGFLEPMPTRPEGQVHMPTWELNKSWGVQLY